MYIHSNEGQDIVAMAGTREEFKLVVELIALINKDEKCLTSKSFELMWNIRRKLSSTELISNQLELEYEE